MGFGPGRLPIAAKDDRLPRNTCRGYGRLRAVRCRHGASGTDDCRDGLRRTWKRAESMGLGCVPDDTFDTALVCSWRCPRLDAVPAGLAAKRVAGSCYTANHCRRFGWNVVCRVICCRAWVINVPPESA
jgi:hypothetical protein